jgi:uncharacterized coiled-coil protein SlyX
MQSVKKDITIKDIIRKTKETNDIATSTIEVLSKQEEQLNGVHNKLNELSESVNRSNKIIKRMLSFSQSFYDSFITKKQVVNETKSDNTKQENQGFDIIKNKDLKISHDKPKDDYDLLLDEINMLKEKSYVIKAQLTTQNNIIEGINEGVDKNNANLKTNMNLMKKI